MRLLMVEDEVRLAQIVSAGLSAEGYAVDVAHDGQNGLRMAQENQYDVILLDIMLPRLNGYQVCDQLRKSGNDTPILMLTAKDGEYDETEGLDTGADDYLTKPFSFRVLEARIRALMRRGHRSDKQPTVWRFGGLEIDPATKTCRRDGKTISVTAKEFAVMEYLAARVGQIVSKTEILQNVWDLGYDGDVNIVEVYVSNLRRKLDGPFGTSSIVTMRGAGYQLRSDGG